MFFSIIFFFEKKYIILQINLKRNTMKRIFSIILVTTILFTVLSSCIKSKENNILGQWRQISYQKPYYEHDTLFYVLEFRENYRVYGWKMEKGSPKSTGEANWEVKRKNGSIVLVIETEPREKAFAASYEFGDLRGVYRFVQDDRDILKIVRIEGWDAPPRDSIWVRGGKAYLLMDLLRQ